MGKKLNKVLASSTVACLVVSAAPVMPAFAKTADPVKGGNRYETAIAIAQKSWEGQWKDSKTAILSAGNDENLVDALTVAPLAFQEKAPILFTEARANKLNDKTKEALKKNGVTKVFLVAGTTILNDKIEAELKEMNITIERLGGATRFETAQKIAKEVKDSKAVAIVNGTKGLADALSIAPIAAAKNITIAIADGTKVSADTKDKTVYAIGGKNAISEEVVTATGAKRIAGDNRYDTNAEVIKAFKGDLDLSKMYVGGADNKNLVDSLAGSVLAGQTKSPIVLVDKANGTIPQIEKLSAVKPANAEVVALGGGLDKAVDTLDKATAGEVSIASATPVAVKKVTVKFSKAVEDTSKASFELKRGTIVSNISKKTWSEDKTSVDLELSNNIIDGEYTLNVSGLTEKPLTTKFTAKQQAISKIEIKSDKLVIGLNNNKTASVYVDILNQYGEKATNADLIITASKPHTTGNVNKDGVLTLLVDELGSDFVRDEKVTLSIMDRTTGVTDTKVLTVSDKQAVSEFEIVGLKPLSGNSNVKIAEGTAVSQVGLYIKAKDQYGNAITDKAAIADTIIASSSNPNVLSIDTANSFAKVNSDNNGIYLVVKGANADVSKLGGGNTTLTLFSKFGAKATTDINVTENAKSKSITLSQPDYAVAGRDIVVPFSLLDQNGADVTNNINVARTVTLGIAGAPGASVAFEESGLVNKTVKLVVKNVTNTGMITVTALTATNEYKNLNINVVEASKVQYIETLGTTKKNVIVGDTGVIKLEDIKVKDQYGLSMDATKANIKVTSADDKLIANVDEEGIKLSANGKVNSKITVELVGKDSKVVSGSAYELPVTMVENSDIKSYEIADIAKNFEGTAQKSRDIAVKVNGVLADGTKVEMQAGRDFNITSCTNGEVDYTTTAGTLVNKGKIVAAGQTEGKYTIIVTVNADGGNTKALTKEVVVANEAPKAAKLSLVDDKDGAYKLEAGKTFEIIKDNTNADAIQYVTSKVKMVDQYGVELTPVNGEDYIWTTTTENDGNTLVVSVIAKNNVDQKIVFKVVK